MTHPSNVATIWNWLPAFRAVAETEHLPSASERVHVSGGALSRTIRLLEEHLGKPLFDRVGRNLKLNAHGRRLLRAVRDAMDALDSGYVAIAPATMSGALYISTIGTIAHAFVLPALQQLIQSYPDVVPELRTRTAIAANHELRSGALDIAFYARAVATDDLVVERLGDVTTSIYCGPGHPLFEKSHVPLRDVLRHAFVAPVSPASGDTLDHWPFEIPRRVGMWLEQLPATVDVCENGTLLAALPDALVAKQRAAGRVHRLDIDIVEPAPLFAARSRHLGVTRRTDSVIEQVRKQVTLPQALAPAMQPPHQAA